MFSHLIACNRVYDNSLSTLMMSKSCPNLKLLHCVTVPLCPR